RLRLHLPPLRQRRPLPHPAAAGGEPPHRQPQFRHRRARRPWGRRARPLRLRLRLHQGGGALAARLGPGALRRRHAADRLAVGDGRIRVDMTFVANRPTAVASIPLDPVRFGCDALDILSRGASSALTAPLRSFTAQSPLSGVTFDPVYTFITLANLMTAGYAARELCISREQVEKLLILLHFNKHYQAVAGSIQTWRQIRNWLDEASLPRWVVTGEST